MSGAAQDRQRQQETGVLQEWLHQSCPPFLWLLRAHCAPKNKVREGGREEEGGGGGGGKEEGGREGGRGREGGKEEGGGRGRGGREGGSRK